MDLFDTVLAQITKEAGLKPGLTVPEDILVEKIIAKYPDPINADVVVENLKTLCTRDKYLKKINGTGWEVTEKWLNKINEQHEL